MPAPRIQAHPPGREERGEGERGHRADPQQHARGGDLRGKHRARPGDPRGAGRENRRPAAAIRGMRKNDWYVVRNARMPAVLTEVGFVTQPRGSGPPGRRWSTCKTSRKACTLASAHSSRDSNDTGVAVLDRLDFLLRMRIRGKPAILGLVFLGILALSLLLFPRFRRPDGATRSSFSRLTRANAWSPRSVSSPATAVWSATSLSSWRASSSGPTRHDALRIFPRGASVLSALMHGQHAVP